MWKSRNYLLLFSIIVLSPMALGGDIGLGQVEAIKEYDFSVDKMAKIYLSSDAAYVNSACLEGDRPVGIITHSKHSAASIARMFSLATAAYMAGKKVRLYSGQNSCEVDLVGLQESRF